jgi:hypothetical protein
MNEAQVRENRMKAALKWGKSTVRPQDIYPGLLEARRMLNTFDDDIESSHPYSSEIMNWCLTSKMLKDVNPPNGFNLVSVEDPETLLDAAKNMAKEIEISVSIKTSDQSYLGLTCVLLVGTPSTVYLIDTLKLHASIGRALQKIFRNPYIVKIFFMGKDIPLLQRDFAIFPVGVILAQEVYSYLYPEQNYVTKHEMFSTLCDYQWNDLIDLADICHRPITLELKNLLAEETWHLLRSWLGLKVELKDSLPMAELEIQMRKFDYVCEAASHGHARFI